MFPSQPRHAVGDNTGAAAMSWKSFATCGDCTYVICYLIYLTMCDACDGLMGR